MIQEAEPTPRLRPDPADAGWDQRERRAGGGLLLVHAHPDDECFSTGGLIARTIAEGRRVDLVTCTGGEEGEIHDPDLDQEEARPRLRDIRRGELECSVRALGSGNLRLHLLGYRDSGMMGTPSNERADVFWRADLEEAAGRLVRIVREARPEVMVSYDENGNYGHPDHINAHRIAVSAFEAAADGHRYPEAGQPHAVERFYETAFNREAFLGLMLELSRRGIALPWDMGGALTKANDALGAMGLTDFDTTDMSVLRRVADALATAMAEETDPEQGSFGMPDAELHARIDVSDFLDQKRRAMDCHRTQRQDFGWLLDMPEDLRERASATEYFMLTRWRDQDIPPGYMADTLFPE